MQDCTFWLMDHSAAVSIDDCNNCKIYVGPVESRCAIAVLPTFCGQLLCTWAITLPARCSVFVRDCRGCRCSVICRQFRCGPAGRCGLGHGRPALARHLTWCLWPQDTRLH